MLLPFAANIKNSVVFLLTHRFFLTFCNTMLFKSSLLLGLLPGVFAGSLRASEEPELSSNVLSAFENWATKFDKFYSSEEEKLERIKIWFHNHGT